MTDKQPMEAALSAFRTPESFYCSPDAALRVVSFNAASGVVVTVSGRFLGIDGQVRPFVFTHTPNTDRTKASSDTQLGEGWILSATAIASSGSPVWGQTFVRLEVIQGTGGTTVLGVLAMGHVTAGQRLAFPGQPPYAPHERPGVIRSVTGTDPAAGAEVSETVPSGARWRLRALSIPFVTSAVVANRRVVIRLSDGVNTIVDYPGSTTIGASANERVSWLPGGTAIGTTSFRDTYVLPFPIELLAGWKFSTVTENLDVGDNYGAPQYVVEEWLEAAS